MLTVGNVIRDSLQEREKEVKKLSDLVNLEYYDEWRWKKKKSKEFQLLLRELTPSQLLRIKQTI